MMLRRKLFLLLNRKPDESVSAAVDIPVVPSIIRFPSRKDITYSGPVSKTVTRTGPNSISISVPVG